jgi:GMP synthase-like glutamine amidotransferase
VLGVQWHPEWLDDDVSHRIFAHFSAVCARRGAVSSGISSTTLERMNTTELHLDLRGNAA